MSGQEDVTLTNLTLAAHTHFAQYAPSGSGSIGGSATAQMKVSSDNDAGDEPAGTYLGKNDGGGLYASATGARMDANAITVDTSGLTVDTSGMGGTVNLTPTGVGQSHNNMQPYEVINWIVCMIGVYPSRS
jgi:microcystin-dependent protein